MEKQVFRLYGRQKSRPITEAQQELFDFLLPNIAVDIQELTKAKKAILEIGFGSGEHLAHKSTLDPSALCIGCEPFLNGVATLLTHVDEAHKRNIRVHHGDVRSLYEELPDASFDEIYLLYPDPWPKKRHWKRRFVQTDTFAEMARLLKPNGKWYIATDHPSYQEWIESHMDMPAALAHFDFVNKDATGTVWDNFKSTRYQEKAFREGRTPRYYTLELNSRAQMAA